MGFGLGRPAGPSSGSAGARRDGQRQLALIDSPGRGQVGGGGEREVYEGGCIYSPGAGAETQSGLLAGK